MPLVENLPQDQKAKIYDFWAASFQAIGIEPVVTQNPSSWLFLHRDAVDLGQVEALRAIAQKYLTFADRLEAEIRRLQPVAPEQNGAGEEDDMPEPIVRGAAPRGTDGRGGPVPAPVEPRTRTRGR